MPWFLGAFSVMACLIGLSHVLHFADRWRKREQELGFAKDFWLDVAAMGLVVIVLTGLVIFAFNVDCIPPSA